MFVMDGLMILVSPARFKTIWTMMRYRVSSIQMFSDDFPLTILTLAMISQKAGSILTMSIFLNRRLPVQ